jgi:hypothetical protein
MTAHPEVGRFGVKLPDDASRQVEFGRQLAPSRLMGANESFRRIPSANRLYRLDPPRSPEPPAKILRQAGLDFGALDQPYPNA